jgi:hypothetical protein
MTARRSLYLGAWLLTLIAGIGIGTAIGQQNPLKDNKGLDAKVVSTIDLAPDMPGYQLRLRTITIEPPAWPAFTATRPGRSLRTSWKGR